MSPKFYPLLSFALVSVLMDPMNIVHAQRAPSTSSSSIKRSKTAPVNKSFSRAAAVKSRPSKTRSVPSVGSKTISPTIRSGSSGRYVPKPVSRPPAKSPLNAKAGKFSKNVPLPTRSKSTQVTLPKQSSSETSGRFGYSPSGVRLPVTRIPGSPKKTDQKSSKKILYPGISRSVKDTATKSSLRTGGIQELGNPQRGQQVFDSKVIRGISEAGRQRAANVPPPPSREAASAISEAGRRQRGRDPDSSSRARESADNALPDSADEVASGDDAAEDAAADEADVADASDHAADQDQDAVEDAVPDAEEIAIEGSDDADHHEEYICSHHCVGHCHHHGIQFGLNFPLWGFASGPDGIFIRTGHRYAVGYTEEIVAVEPENSAVEIRELPNLPQVHAAATVSLSSETALGQQPGQVFLDVNGIVLPATVVTWSNESATCTLPMMGVDQSKAAQLIMVTAEGTVAHWIAIELLPPQPPQDVPES